MPKCAYYSSKDIQEYLGVGKRKANEILHMFEQRGQLFRDGKTLRVRISYFEEWLRGIDGGIVQPSHGKKTSSHRRGL